MSDLEDGIERRQRAEELFLEMKDTSELMVDLAYSAVLFNSRSIAKEVEELEESVGETLNELNRNILELVQSGSIQIDQAMVILRVAQTAEAIANAALEIVDVVLREVELHPVLAEAISESDSTIARATVGEGCEFLDRTLKEIEFETETGMRILAVKRQGRWTSGVGGEFVLIVGDVIVASGDWEAQEEFLTRIDPNETEN